jgi:hypothetical protein
LCLPVSTSYPFLTDDIILGISWPGDFICLLVYYCSHDGCCLLSLHTSDKYPHILCLLPYFY